MLFQIRGVVIMEPSRGWILGCRRAGPAQRPWPRHGPVRPIRIWPSGAVPAPSPGRHTRPGGTGSASTHTASGGWFEDTGGTLVPAAPTVYKVKVHDTYTGKFAELSCIFFRTSMTLKLIMFGNTCYVHYGHKT